MICDIPHFAIMELFIILYISIRTQNIFTFHTIDLPTL